MSGQKIEITMTEQGEGAPIFVLHGGGGPLTVAGLATHMASDGLVLMPTHPGWNGTLRPASVSSVADLAELYLRELEQRDLNNVLVIGSSMGGWIAAEMALRDSQRRIGRVVLINSVGVEVPGEPIVDFFSLTPRQIAEHSYHDPDRFFVNPQALPPERLALIQGNVATLRAVAGTRMADPELLKRLREVMIPALVIWGESDRIVTAKYGRAMAEAFGNGRFALVEKAGHLPHIEQPEATFALIDAFINSLTT
ncbi:alpha/beta fold hydrolase [Asticcacaulis sp. 201]|uniref:alpha/beta fold hydrolase n=1 Tax=Asticcacaulis sp. 201 TaxID=3028787 RepID=UPI002916A49B|nr:alpha/beta fold hydrolase [Asticcacaulis sp. 201]MDV6330412.1 alpha/beta fold hydrolase [Asticcacaulis sp. 201]